MKLSTSKRSLPIISLLLVSFVLRFTLSFLPSFEIDMNTWLSWANRLADLGPGKFYSDIVWTQYTPGFLYWLWFGGAIGWISEFMVKMPTLFSDLVVGGLIWHILKRENRKLANLSFVFYVLNPVVIFNGSVWGQIEGILSLFLFLAVYFVVQKKNITLSFISWTIAFLIKPQALVLLPPLGLIILKKFPIKKVFLSGLASIATILILSFPFFPNNPIFGLFQQISKMTGYYSYTSVFAFNFWSLVGMWQADSLTFLGISYFWWGIILYSLSMLALLYKFREKLKGKTAYLVVALSILASFLFPTRVHERYLFPLFPFLLISGGLLKSRFLFFSYFLLSFLNLINLYHPYAYYTENFLRSETLLKITGDLAPAVAVLTIIVFLGLLFWKKVEPYFKALSLKKLKALNLRKLAYRNKSAVKLPKTKISETKLKYALWGILIFSFIARIFSLGSPPNEYFDEVYHAFTARRMLHNDPKAWEWWNTPPEGFAYEWTHPPLAKLGMVLGMKVFGENSFGWRFPGALLGVGSIYLIYLIARQLFKDRLIGVLASLIFALDGLPLVMSRIAMNDIYFLFFALLSIYLFLKDKHLFSSLAFGLALSSKWSTFWVVPILAVSHFVFKKKLSLTHLWFVVIPPIIYLATYIPMFLTGHGFDIFVGVQKQMWWYHTGLDAAHSYTSSWWSWPLMTRPIYLYTSGEVGGFVSKIYAMGNPLVFWFGLFSIFLLIYHAYTKRSRKLGFLVFSYFFFFVPWALAPRIMFLYHYLPSLPFLAIAGAFVLRKYPKYIVPFIVTNIVLFIYFYSHWAGLNIPLPLDASYYWLPSWR